MRGAARRVTRWEPGRRLLTTREAAESAGVSEAVIYQWVSRGLLLAVGYRKRGRRKQPLYLEAHVLAAQRQAGSWHERSTQAQRRKHRPRGGQGEDHQGGSAA